MISTAGNAALSIADASANATGRLVNGAFSLPQAVQARATSSAGTGCGVSPPWAAAPARRRCSTTPARSSNDMVALAFRQTIDANDALRTGTYSKTLTFTLSTTEP